MGNLAKNCSNESMCCRGKGKDFKSSETREEDSIEQEEITNTYPENIIEVKVKTSNLVMKRYDNPWNNYVLVQDIGQGTFGTVKKVMLKSKRVYRAMKIINKSNVVEGVNDSEILNEINVLKNLDHPNIMKIYEFYEDKDNYYIISEFFDQGDLFTKLLKLGYMNEVIVKFLMSQILNAVSYLHSKKVLHGDIKMENILLYTTASGNDQKRFTVLSSDIKQSKFKKNIDNYYKNHVENPMVKNFFDDITNYEVKLIDFGCSKIFSKKNHKNLSGIIGTSMYCSPEVIDNKYDEKSDEWSCGVLMYILLSGTVPFKGETEEEIFSNVKKGKINFNKPEFKFVSNSAKDLISKLLEYYPEYRISANQALKHPFFTENFNPNLCLTYHKDLSLLTNLIHVKPIGKFQQTIIAYLVMNFIDKDEEKKLREVFRYCDRNNRNYLSIDDISYTLNNNNFNLSKNEIEHIFEIIDSDRNGYIEYQEFLRILCDKDKLFSEENLKCAFNLLDEEKKGIIDWDNINKFIFNGQDLKSDLIDDYLNQIGLTRDSEINFDKFCEIMKLAK